MICTVTMNDSRLEFDLRRKYSQLIGNSGVGKTSVVRLIGQLHNDLVTCSLPFIKHVEVPGSVVDLLLILSETESNSLFILDEEVCLKLNAKVCSAIHNSNSFFVFVTRPSRPQFPISDWNVLTLSYSGNRYWIAHSSLSRLDLK